MYNPNTCKNTNFSDVLSHPKMCPQSDPDRIKLFPHQVASFIIVLAFRWPVNFLIAFGRFTYRLNSSSSELSSSDIALVSKC